jgi:hypothetical protein
MYVNQKQIYEFQENPRNGKSEKIRGEIYDKIRILAREDLEIT